AVVRDVHAAPWTTAFDFPGVHHQRPHAGNDRVWIFRVERQARAPGVFVDEENAIPGLSAVGGAIDAAFLLRPRGASQRAGEDDVGIRRVNENPADAPRLLEPHVGPGRAGVRRLIDTVANDIGVADRPRFA